MSIARPQGLPFVEEAASKDVGGGDEEEEEDVYASIAKEIEESKKVRFGQVSQHLKIGIIGASNVGKSSLFNIMGGTTKSFVENNLFTTLDPVVVTFEVPDERIEILSALCRPAVGYRKYCSLVDTAAIIAGSGKGEGVGLDSLKAIRNADLLLHVVRAFEDNGMTIVYESHVDPVRDMIIVNQELMLADIEIIDAEIAKLLDIIEEKKALVGQKTLHECETMKRAYAVLSGFQRPEVQDKKRKKGDPPPRYVPTVCRGIFLSQASWDANEVAYLNTFNFFTAKTVLYIVNLTSRDYLRWAYSGRMPSYVANMSRVLGPSQKIFPMSIALESTITEIASKGQAQLKEYQDANPSHVAIVPQLITECYRALDLIQYYTFNDKEVRSWIIRRGTSVGQAPNCVDVNISRYLSTAEVTSFEAFVAAEGDHELLVKEGSAVNRGKKHIVNDGDILAFNLVKK